ncbi:MAG: alpha/beta hydrolase [Jatrophihabitantaceae bacterium]
MHQTTASDSTKIAYEKVGDGPPVIIVGGAFHDRNAGAGLARALSSHFTVVTYDRRGRGDSGDSASYSVAQEIEDLGAVISEVGGSACLYGVSSGGILALETAAAGYSVPKIAAFEPPYRCGQGPELGPDVVPTLSELIRAGKRRESVEYFLSAIMAVPSQDIEHMRKMPIWPELEAVSHTLVYDTMVVGDRTWPAARMASVKEPTLVMSSGASVPWMKHTAQTIGERLANGEHVSVAGTPHDASPKVLAPVLISFFNE